MNRRKLAAAAHDFGHQLRTAETEPAAAIKATQAKAREMGLNTKDTEWFYIEAMHYFVYGR